MNRETYEYFGEVVSFDEKKLRSLLASQLHIDGYVEGKKKIIAIIFDRKLSYEIRKEAMFKLFEHLDNQGVVVSGNSCLTTSQMLDVLRNNLV